jgi:hypothetical protein
MTRKFLPLRTQPLSLILDLKIGYSSSIFHLRLNCNSSSVFSHLCVMIVHLSLFLDIKNWKDIEVELSTASNRLCPVSRL